MGQNAGAVCRSHNDIARDMLGVIAVIVLPFTTATLIAGHGADCHRPVLSGWSR